MFVGCGRTCTCTCMCMQPCMQPFTGHELKDETLHVVILYLMDLHMHGAACCDVCRNTICKCTAKFAR